MRSITRITEYLIVLIIFISFATGATEKLERTRIAIFNEKGFPNKSKRNIDWFREAATSIGGIVNILNLKEIESTECFSKEKYDTIIFPHGGYVPLDAEKPLGRFMRQGGTIIIAGDIFGSLPYPDNVNALYQKLDKEFQTDRGLKIGEYGDFLLKNGMIESCFVKYDSDLKRWLVPVSSFYYYFFVCKRILPEFGLYPWPNAMAGKFNNQRSFCKPIAINTSLKQLLPAFPEYIIPDEQTKKLTFARVQDPSLGRVDGIGDDGIFSYNKLISIYRFEKPSGYKYPDFENAGQKEEDRNTDFFIYRYHDRLHEGASLIVLGKTGTILLESERGTSILTNLLKLAESRLPDEYDPKYYKKFHKADELLSYFQATNVNLCSLLVKYAQKLFYENDIRKYGEIENLLETKKAVFNDLASRYFALTQVRIKGLRVDEKEIEKVINCLENETIKSLDLIELYSQKLKTPLNISYPIPIKHPFRTLREMVCYLGPEPTHQLKNIFLSFKSIGISEAPLHANDWNKLGDLYEISGISSNYKLAYNATPYPSKRNFKMGVLDPKTGSVSYQDASWFPDSSAWKKYEMEMSWFLKKAAEQKGITGVIYGEERDMGWSLWGDYYMLPRFLKYLNNKYGNIENLNNIYDTGYSDFSQIKLPIKRPETQQEHALWEDWTRYREIYRIQEEVAPLIKISKKYAPNLINWVFGSYDQQGRHPANGINYYEIGKLLDPVSMEGTFRIKEEVVNCDICAFQKKLIISEWGTFYFPPSGVRPQIDLLKEAFWNSVNTGMIGCNFFLGWRSNPNFVGADGLIKPLGNQLKEINTDLKAIQHIYLDGQREEVPIRILYSPTTRRHSSWPEIEGDKSLDAVCGYYNALRSLHCQARAIDEMAIMEGKLPAETKILIVPQVNYMNKSLFEKLEVFVKNGGILITTSDSGCFDEYGRRQDYLLTMSCVSRRHKIKAKTLENITFKTFEKDIYELNAILPENAKTVFHYEDGSAAAICSKYGNGQVLILGFPFGLEYNNSLKNSPQASLALLKKILDSVNFQTNYICPDDHLVIRPWFYNKEKYLMLNYLQRDEMTIQKKAKGFPFKKTSSLIPFELKIRGTVDVEDYLLGKKLNSTFDGAFTIVKGIIENPGGSVYRLIPSTAKKVSQSVSGEMPAVLDNNHSSESKTDGIKSYELPFEGRLFADDGKIKIGNYILAIDVVTNGNWGGKFYLNIEHNGKKIQKECKNDINLKFQFPDTTLTVECKDVISVMPWNIECRISENKNKIMTSEECCITEEMFYGQNSIVLKNNYIFVRILPDLGGRIIEFKTGKSSPNNMFCDTKAISKGVISDSWANYGGMEENAGAFPGPCWNISFRYKILEYTKDKIILKMERSVPIRWSSPAFKPHKKEGYNSFEKTFTLEKDSSFIDVNIREYNEIPQEDMLTLKTHPVFSIGGDISSSDILYYPTKNGDVASLPYRINAGGQFKNNGDWCIFLDKDKCQGVMQSFEKNKVCELYTWMGESGYNVELIYNLFRVPPGKYMDFAYRMGIIEGLSGICTFKAPVAIDLIPEGKRMYGKHQKVKFTIDVASVKNTTLRITPFIKNPQGESIKKFDVIETLLAPNNSLRFELEWDTKNFSDGTYKFGADFSNDGEKSFQFSRNFDLIGESLRKSEGEITLLKNKLDTLKTQYNETGAFELKNKIIRSSILLEELKDACLINNRRKMEDLSIILRKIYGIKSANKIESAE